MRSFGILLILTMSLQTDFPQKGYDKVILYPIQIDEQSGMSRLFDAEGNIANKAKGIKIDQTSVNALVKIINDTLTYGAMHSYSHAPTIAIVFYKKGKIVDWLEIALATNSVSSKGHIRNQLKYYGFLNNLEYPLTGLSPSGRSKIRHWIKDRGVDDEGSYYLHWDSTAIDYTTIRRKF